MRCVTIYLRNTTSAAVAALLTRICPGQQAPWIWRAESDPKDPALYINVYDGGVGDCSFDSEVRASVLGALGIDPSVTVQVDVSGRHAGDSELRELLSNVLASFDGRVQDEYTGHCWTLDELLSDHQEQGHRFFDYKGRRT